MGETPLSLPKTSTGALIAIIAIGILLTVTTAGVLSLNQLPPPSEEDRGSLPENDATPSPTNDGAPDPESDSVPSSGNIATINVGVYSDRACKKELTSIDWGDIFPGETVNRTIYVKNTGNIQITLSMTNTNWNPSTANESITLTWNKEDITLNTDEDTEAMLTLSISQDISEITEFSVDVVIIGKVG